MSFKCKLFRQIQMSAKPSLSVIIPHLNDADGLERCLAALAREAQDVPGLEVVVVDNGSREMPASLVARYHDMQLVSESKPGPGPARSTGAKIAKADILAFIDSDCEAHPGWAAGILEHFADPSAAPIIGGDVRIALRNPPVPDFLEAYESVYGYRQKLYITRDKYPATCNLAMRAEIFADVGDFAGIEIAEDMDWGKRATTRGHDMEYKPDIRIATPARETFGELKRKMDRQIGHDFAKVGPDRTDRMRWGLRALTLIASPAIEVARVMTSDRLKGVGSRLKAFVCLTQVRFYRGWRMLGLLIIPDKGAMSGAWNRD